MYLALDIYFSNIQKSIMEYFLKFHIQIQFLFNRFKYRLSVIIFNLNQKQQLIGVLIYNEIK